MALSGPRLEAGEKFGKLSGIDQVVVGLIDAEVVDQRSVVTYGLSFVHLYIRSLKLNCSLIMISLGTFKDTLSYIR